MLRLNSIIHIQVRQSYSRFKELEMLQRLLVIDRTKLGMSITRSLLNFLRNRCHILFFSSSLNSVQTVRDNIMSMFTMCAKRMHVLFRRTNFSRITINTPFMGSMIRNCIRYGAQQVCFTLNRKQKLQLSELFCVENSRYQLDDSLLVSHEEVGRVWLCC